jgi:hypothetical protein
MTQDDGVRDHCDRSYEEILARCTSMLETMNHLLLGFEPVNPSEARRMTRMPSEGSDQVIGCLADEYDAIQLE